MGITQGHAFYLVHRRCEYLIILSSRYLNTSMIEIWKLYKQNEKIKMFRVELHAFYFTDVTHGGVSYTQIARRSFAIAGNICTYLPPSRGTCSTEFTLFLAVFLRQLARN